MKILKDIVYSNLFVASVLGTLTLSTYSTLSDLSLRWNIWIAVFFGSFFLYNFHRLYKIEYIPEHQLEERHYWVLKHSKKIKLSMTLSVLLMMTVMPYFNEGTLVALLPAGIISVGYTIPIFPTENGWRRFRDIPLIKPLIIASVVAYLTLAFPVFDQWGFQAVCRPLLVGLFIERMFFLLAVTIPFDLRDLQSDTDSGTTTLATYLGFKAAKKVGLLALFVWIALVVVNKYLDHYSARQALVLVLLGLLLVYGYIKTEQNNSDMFYVLCFEGSILLYALALILVQTMP